MASVPPGGLILVTGANSYVASIATEVSLQRDYRVRGNARSIDRNAWMEAYFGSKYKLVGVPDINTPDAFDGVLKDVDGIAHVAINIDMNTHSQCRMDETSVVIMPSLAACTLSTTGVQSKLNSSPWHSKGNSRWHGIVLYGASKACGEQDAFTWAREHKPAFCLNTVLRNVNFGTAVSPEIVSYRSFSAVIDAVVKGSPAAPTILPSQWYINVEDTALLHLGALKLDDVHDERLLAFAGRYSWAQLLEIFHRRYPHQVMLELLDEPAVYAGEVEKALIYLPDSKLFIIRICLAML